jgi:hypothetical protein
MKIVIIDHDRPPSWKSQQTPVWLLLQSEINRLCDKHKLPTFSFIDPDSKNIDTASIRLDIHEDSFYRVAVEHRKGNIADHEYSLEEYRILVTNSRIQIDATDTQAAHWAIMTLLKCMRLDQDSLYVDQVEIRDWPDYPVRVATINGSMRNQTQIDNANRIADFAYEAKFNEIEWNNNDAGRNNEKPVSLAASLALRKKIERRGQRLSMSVDRTAYTVENPAWQEAIPVVGTPMKVRDSVLTIDPEAEQIIITNNSFEQSGSDSSGIPQWRKVIRSGENWIAIDSSKSRTGIYSLRFDATDELCSGGVSQEIAVNPFNYLNLRLWYQAEEFRGQLWVRAQDAETREPIDALMTSNSAPLVWSIFA